MNVKSVQFKSEYRRFDNLFWIKHSSPLILNAVIASLSSRHGYADSHHPSFALNLAPFFQKHHLFPSPSRTPLCDWIESAVELKDELKAIKYGFSQEDQDTTVFVNVKTRVVSVNDTIWGDHVGTLNFKRWMLLFAFKFYDKRDKVRAREFSLSLT